MNETGDTFGTEQEAKDFCSRQAEADGRKWINWQLPDGKWKVAATSLPNRDAATNTATETKPKPPDPDDPRSASQQALGPGYY